MEVLKSIGRELVSAVGGLVGEAVAELLVYSLLIAMFAILTIPIYLLLKTVSRRETTVVEDLHELLNPPRRKIPRSPLLDQLDGIQSGVEAVYQYILYAVIVLATGFIAYFFYGIRNDSSRAFLHVYFGGGYLLLMAWAGSQLVAMHRKRARRGTRTAASEAVRREPPPGETGFQIRYQLRFTPGQLAVLAAVFLAVLAAAVTVMILLGRVSSR